MICLLHLCMRQESTPLVITACSHEPAPGVEKNSRPDAPSSHITVELELSKNEVISNIQWLQTENDEN